MTVRAAANEADDVLFADALLPDVVAAHCLWCPQVVRGFDPVDVHDRMEAHYGQDHRQQIAAALELLR